MAEINREAQEFADIMSQVNREMRLYGELTKDTADKRRDAEMKAKYGFDDFTKASGMGASALEKLGSAAKAAGGAALEGSKKASSMNGAFDELTSAAKFAAVGLSLLVPGGPLIKGIVAGLALLATSAFDAANKYREAAVKVSDQLYEGYSALAQSGAAASDGMTGLFEDAKKLGYSLGELSQYTALVAEGSKDLALFGGTVFEGRQQFAEMGKSFEKYSGHLIAAGFTQTQINEGMMGYLKLQSRAGLSQNKTSAQLAEGARKYLLEMDGLSKITGQTRKEMESQRERQLLNEQFSAKIRELQLKGTPEALAFAENLKIAGNIAARAGPQMEEAFLASVTGNYANEKAIGANIVSGNALMANIQKMGQGIMTPVEAMQGTFQAMGKFGDSLNGLAQVNAFEAAFGIKYSAVQEARLLGEGNLVKNLEKAEAERKKQGAEGGQAADDAVAAQVNFQTAMRKANEQIERFFVPGMAKATDAAALFALSAEGVAARMNKLFGIGSIPKEKDTASVPTLDKAKQDLDASTEKAALANERAQAAEKDANMSRAEKDRIKKEARESEAAVAQDIRIQREAQLKEQNARRAARREGMIPQSGTAPAAGGMTKTGFKPASGGAAPAAAPAAPAPSSTASSAPASKTVPTAHAQSGGGSDSKPRLARISSASGKSASVNEKYAPAFQNLLDYLGRAGYEVKDLGGYNDRDATGKPGQKSIHAHGAAIDINSATNPFGSKLVTDMPSEIGQIAASLGLGWGGNWKSVKDAMHFSAAESEGGKLLKAQDGGVFQGPSSGYNVELHGKEAVIPLKDGAVPVSLNLKDALATPTFGGMNEYAGLNQGPISTDIDAVKKLAEAVGAFDKTSQIITDPATWKQILSSGLATNYNLVNANIGTKGLPGLDQDMADRLKEIKEQGNITTEEALKQVAEELKIGMSSMAEQFAVTMTSRAYSVDSSEIAPLLQELVSATKNGNDINTKILATSY
jgi:hypothetical protein